MKKLFFAFCMILLCSSQVAMAQSKTKAQTAQTKASMLSDLRTDISESIAKEGASKEKADKFADCLTKDLGAKLTLEELKIFHKLNFLKAGKEKDELIKKAEKMGINKKIVKLGGSCGALLK